MARVNLDLHKLFLPIYLPSAFSMRKYQILAGGRSTAKSSRHVSRIVAECVSTPFLVNFGVAAASGKLETGIMSEFEKVCERAGLKKGKLSGRQCVGGNFAVRTKPSSIIFDNGSIIHFEGSKNWEDLKGRSVKGGKYRFGFVYLDEFADYDEKVGMQIVSGLYNTFVRDDYQGEDNHFIWGSGAGLDLNKVVRDEDGNIIYDINDEGIPVARLKLGRDTFGCKVLISTNPPKNREHWFFDWLKEYGKREDAFFMHVNYNTKFFNPLTNKEDTMYNTLIRLGLEAVVAEAEAMKKANYERYRHEFLGEPTSRMGLYFNTFEKENLRVGALPTTFDYFCIGLDFGTVDATAFGLLGVKGTKIFILDQYRHSNGTDPTAKAPSDYATDFHEFVLRNRHKYHFKMMLPVFYDHSAKGFKDEAVKLQNANPRFSKNVNMKKATKNRKPTLDYLFEIITTGDLNYKVDLPYVKDMEDEIRKAEVATNGIDMAKGNDHCIDWLRYGCYACKPKVAKSYRKGFN